MGKRPMVLFREIICASMDAPDVSQVTKEEAIGWLEQIIPFFIGLGKKLLLVVIFVLISRKLIGWLKKFLEKSFARSNLDVGVSKFLLSLINVSLNLILAVAAINMLGIATGSVVAILGSAGLTLGLALQGSLANFSGGVLILIMKPFKIGDYIIAGQDEGCVTGIDIFYTRLLTVDNRKVVIPNGGLSNMSIVNVTNEEARRLDIKIPIDYGESVSRVKEVLWEIVREEAMVLAVPEPVVVVGDFGSSALVMEIHVWTKTENYWPLKWGLLERVKETFDRCGIAIPYEKLNVIVTQQPALGREPENSVN